MSKLVKYDPNMAAQTDSVESADLFFPDPFAPPFRLNGFYWFSQDRTLHRLPQAIARRVSEGVAYYATHTAGGNLCFRTNSRHLYIEAVVTEGEPSSKFTSCGRYGFDVYMRRVDCDRLIHVRTVLPEPGEKKMQLDVPDFSMFLLEGESEILEILINFPPYDGVEAFRLGLEPGSAIYSPAPYALEKPVLFYGSSITQGGCATRPGNAYINHLGRRLNIPTINLGFSGNAKGEPLMAQTIADMDISLFVMDYDHNAPTVEHLAQTHEAFYQIIRAKQPQLPILMLSRVAPRFKTFRPRNEIVRRTYERALASGENNVDVISGEDLFGSADWDACTVDSVHPNDLGFLRMADGIEPVLRQILGL